MDRRQRAYSGFCLVWIQPYKLEDFLFRVPEVWGIVTLSYKDVRRIIEEGQRKNEI